MSLGTGQDVFALNLRACTGYCPRACVELLELVSQWGDKKRLVHKLELVLLVGWGVDVLGNMVGGLLGCHVEVQMG